MHFCGKKIIFKENSSSVRPLLLFPSNAKRKLSPYFLSELQISWSKQFWFRSSTLIVHTILRHMKSWFDPQVCNVWIHIPLTYLEEPIAHLSRIFDPKFSAIFFGHHLPQLFSVLNLGFITDHYFSYSPGFRVYCWLRI